MRLPFVLFLILLFESVAGQQPESAYDSGLNQYTKGNAFHYGIALRGKVIAFPGWEDRFYYTLCDRYGAAFRKTAFFRVDYVFFRINREEDGSDSTGMELSTGTNEYDTRRYLHIDYHLFPDALSGQSPDAICQCLYEAWQTQSCSGRRLYTRTARRVSLP